MNGVRFVEGLKEHSGAIATTLRSVAPEALSSALPAGGTVMQPVGALLIHAITLKTIIVEPRASLEDAKAPSFVSGDEAAGIFESAVAGTLEHIERASPDWDAETAIVEPGDIRNGSRLELAEWLWSEIKRFNNEIAETIASKEPPEIKKAT